MPEKLLPLSGVERLCALRYLRSSKDRVNMGLIELQEKVQLCVDTTANADAYRALDADKAVLDTIIRKLWRLDEIDLCGVTTGGSQRA